MVPGNSIALLAFGLVGHGKGTFRLFRPSQLIENYAAVDMCFVIAGIQLQSAVERLQRSLRLSRKLECQSL